MSGYVCQFVSGQWVVITAQEARERGMVHLADLAIDGGMVPMVALQVDVDAAQRHMLTIPHFGASEVPS